MSDAPSILIIAGEVSGDMHAAALVRAIRARAPKTRFYGIGGDAMAAEGVELHQHVRDMAVMGLTEVLARLPFFRRVFRQTLDLARTRRPDAVLLVDYPGFNLRFAACAHAMGLKVIYYICPQVWAWNRARIPRMARIVDRLLAIFPFEPAVFAGTGLAVDFVGHPLVDELRRVPQTPLDGLPWDPRAHPLVALLPGSRVHEVQRILPSVWAAAGRIAARMPEAAFVIATPDEAIADQVREFLRYPGAGPGRYAVVAGRTRLVLRNARAAIVASGTATLEAALLECPSVLVYRTSALTYALARMLIRMSHIGIVNIIAGRTVMPEFIQGAVQPAAIADAVLALMPEAPARHAALRGYQTVAATLGEGGAAARAAGIVLEEIARTAAGPAGRTS